MQRASTKILYQIRFDFIKSLKQTIKFFKIRIRSINLTPSESERYMS